MSEAVHREYDVVIVGGGIAGLAAANMLARTGCRVAVLEKDDYPRHRVCGEYVAAQSADFLEELGINLANLYLPRISKLHVTDTRGNEVYAPMAHGGIGISRYLLDDELARAAIDAGVHLYTRCKADQVQWQGDTALVTTTGHTFSARVVCGAWGKRSNIDIRWQRPFTQERKASLNNYVGIKHHIRYRLPQDVVYLHNFSSGYCGISPVEDGIHCLCYLTTAAELRACGNNIERLERETMSRNSWLKDIFERASFLYPQPLAISQISFEKKEQVRDHVLMLGDTAGMITPLCGNGMTMALHAAKIASALVALYLEGGITRSDMERGYVRAWKQQFAGRTALGRMVQQSFGKEATTALFLKAMKHIRPVRNAIISKVAGQVF